MRIKRCIVTVVFVCTAASTNLQVSHVQDINSAVDTISATCKSLDEQDSLKGTIQHLKRCQAADEARMQSLLYHISDLGVDTASLPTAGSWRRQPDDTAEDSGAILPPLSMRTEHATTSVFCSFLQSKVCQP